VLKFLIEVHRFFIIAETGKIFACVISCDKREVLFSIEAQFLNNDSELVLFAYKVLVQFYSYSFLGVGRKWETGVSLE
jgi:hypothetical protein